ncbi:MAG: hypothetical protein AB7F76_00815 [Parvibaculaceae bacterium]
MPEEKGRPRDPLLAVWLPTSPSAMLDCVPVIPPAKGVADRSRMRSIEGPLCGDLFGDAFEVGDLFDLRDQAPAFRIGVFDENLVLCNIEMRVQQIDAEALDAIVAQKHFADFRKDGHVLLGNRRNIIDVRQRRPVHRTNDKAAVPIRFAVRRGVDVTMKAHG